MARRFIRDLHERVDGGVGMAADSGSQQGRAPRG
jgi:hypothetical protein